MQQNRQHRQPPQFANQEIGHSGNCPHMQIGHFHHNPAIEITRGLQAEISLHHLACPPHTNPKIGQIGNSGNSGNSGNCPTAHIGHIGHNLAIEITRGLQAESFLYCQSRPVRPISKSRELPLPPRSPSAPTQAFMPIYCAPAMYGRGCAASGYRKRPLVRYLDIIALSRFIAFHGKRGPTRWNQPIPPPTQP